LRRNGARISMIRLDFPEPETPVTTARHSSGIRAVTFCRLFSRASVSVRKCFGSDLFFGRDTSISPARNRPVSELLSKIISL
jgi:hypothetical protein